jgi:predicted RNA-binding protein with PIN domain
MTTFSVDVPDDQIDRIYTAIAASLGWQAEYTNDDGNVTKNPETIDEFIERIMAQYLGHIVSEYEVSVALTQARQQAADYAESSRLFTSSRIALNLSGADTASAVDVP